jgi:predicted DCC family thiol-disulfide oxidoreductase YuxK
MRPVSVVYDPDCGFCRVCMAVLLRWDRQGRLRPVPLFSSDADALLEGMPRATQAASWHAVDERGTVHSGGAAFAPVLEQLPRGKRLAALARRYPRPLELSYRWVADHRALVGRFVPASAREWANDALGVSGPAPRSR